MIRIMDSKIKNKIFYELKYKDEFKSILTLYFDDIDYSNDSEIILKNNDLYHFYKMTNYDKKKLLIFLKKHIYNVSKIIIHCHYGVSRSPAVALSLSKLFKDIKFQYLSENNLYNFEEYIRLKINFNRYVFFKLTNIRYLNNKLEISKFHNLKFKI